MSWDWDKLQEKRRNQGKSPKNWSPESPHRSPQKGGSWGINASKTPPVWFVVAVVVVVWLGFGLFFVGPDEVGVVTRFGHFNREASTGPNFRIPYPFEAVTLVQTKEQNLELGRSAKTAKRTGGLDLAMITDDQGLVFVRYRVRYKIENPREYLSGANNPEVLLEHIANRAVRAGVSRRSTGDLLEKGYENFQNEVLAAINEELKARPVGLAVASVQVINVEPPEEAEEDFKALHEAFKQKAKLLEEVRAYEKSLLPAAEKQAAELLAKAEAESRARIDKARGEARRYAILAESYKKDPAGFMKALMLLGMEDEMIAREKNVTPKDRQPSEEKTEAEGEGKDEKLPAAPQQPAPKPASQQRAKPKGVTS